MGNFDGITELTKLTELGQGGNAELHVLNHAARRYTGFQIELVIAIWAIKSEKAEPAHAERFGIFVGLWAPTFFILSNRFERYAERAEAEKAKTL